MPLREHLETLIRGTALTIETELSNLSEGQKRLEKEVLALDGKVEALTVLENQRAGARTTREHVEDWARWLPTLLTLMILVYVTFGSSG